MSGNCGFENGFSNSLINGGGFGNGFGTPNRRIVTSGLVMRFDVPAGSYDGTGATLVDLSGNGRNATLFNVPAYVSGNAPALRYSRDSFQYAETSTIQDMSAWTAEAWVKFNQVVPGLTQAIVTGMFDGGTKINFTLGTEQGSADIRASFYDGSGWHHTAGGMPVTIGEWKHVAGTYDGRTLKLYVDGELSSSLDYVGAARSGGGVRIAGRWDDVSNNVANFISSDIPVVHVYDRALDASEVARNYRTLKVRYPNASDTSPLVTSGLVLHYDIGTSTCYAGSGATVTDLRGHSNATLTGGPSNTSGYLTFNGTSQYLMTNTGLNSYVTGTVTSVTMWAYPMDNGVLLCERANPPGGGGGWEDTQFEMVTGSLYFRVWDGAGGHRIKSSVATPLNAWYHLAMTYDNVTLRAYVNGTDAGSTAVTRAGPVPDWALRYSIAASSIQSMGDGTYANMRLGQFSVYNKALSSAEVTQNFAAHRARYDV